MDEKQKAEIIELFQQMQNAKSQTQSNPILKYLIIVLVVVIGLLGAYIYFNRPGNVIDNPKKDINEEVTASTQTEVSYVPKSQIKNPLTGAIEKEKTDVEANISQPVVTAKINGKSTEFKLQQGESQKFENGKVVMNQQSKIELDIKTPEKKESLNIGPYAKVSSGNGVSYGVQADYERGKAELSIGYDSKEREFVKAKYNIIKF